MNKAILIAIIGLISLSSVFAKSSQTESNTATYLASIQNDPEKLLLFLEKMPKGGDLHYHAGSGGSSAENWMLYAKGQHFCINRQTFVAYQDTQCPKENLIDNANQDSTFYNAIINNWSMRNFQPLTESGHDHFFATFGKIEAIASQYDAESLAETRNRAADQNESYLELMVLPDGNASGLLGKKIGWNADFAKMRHALLMHGLNDIVINMKKKMDTIEEKEQRILACQTPHPASGCAIKVNYLYETLREQPPEQVFAQLLAAFELAKEDRRFVGINIVQPEDGFISMRDYHLHMQMVSFLHSIYPMVHISLHAGELNSSLVPPEGLRFHIREAIDIAHAERIGHGVDIASEKNAEELLQTMSKQHILTEINLTSNDVILNVKNGDHPLPLYLNYHVPVALSTDDEGISRTTLTLEYQKAILRYHLSYNTVKNMVRNSIYYSFIPGNNLWLDDTYQNKVTECHSDTINSPLSESCQTYLNSNEKAKIQWDLEQRFGQFEKGYQKN